MTTDTVSHEEYKGRCDLCDERFARDNKRLNKLEDAFEVASKLDVKLGLIVEQVARKAKTSMNSAYLRWNRNQPDGGSLL